MKQTRSKKNKIGVNKTDMNFQVMLLMCILENISKTFLSYSLKTFCILRFWVPVSCASTMHIELRYILKFYCAQDRCGVSMQNGVHGKFQCAPFR